MDGGAGGGAGAGAGGAGASGGGAGASPTPHGTVLLAGAVEGGSNLWTHHVFAPLAGKRIVRLIASPSSSHFFALEEGGSLWGWGRNDRGQLGVGDTLSRSSPVLVHAGVASAACGRHHSLIITTSGALLAAGDNKVGQCGVGRDVEVLLKWTPCVGVTGGCAPHAGAIAAGVDFSIALSTGGRVWATGSQQYGQLGGGSSGEHIATGNRILYGVTRAFTPLPSLDAVSVVSLSCGEHHTAALTGGGTVWTWGTGSYGRLGHGTPKDEHSPKCIAYFEPERLRIQSLTAGSSSTFLHAKNGMLYVVGITKKSGEAAMKPSYLQDIVSMALHSYAVGPTSVILAADLSVVTYGPSPTSGELGYGEATKSSTKPKLVDALEGAPAPALQVAMGASTSFVLVDSEACAEFIAKLPRHEGAGAGAGGAGAGAGGKRKAAGGVEEGVTGGAKAKKGAKR